MRGSQEENVSDMVVCSRCGQDVKLVDCGYEKHRRLCIPIVDHYEYFTDEHGLACRLDINGELAYACEHRIYQGATRNVWEKESVFHSESRALTCPSFTRLQQLKRKSADEQARFAQALEALP